MSEDNNRWFALVPGAPVRTVRVREGTSHPPGTAPVANWTHCDQMIIRTAQRGRLLSPEMAIMVPVQAGLFWIAQGCGWLLLRWKLLHRGGPI